MVCAPAQPTGLLGCERLVQFPTPEKSSILANRGEVRVPSVARSDRRGGNTSRLEPTGARPVAGSVVELVELLDLLARSFAPAPKTHGVDQGGRRQYED